MTSVSLKRLDTASLCALPLPEDAARQVLAHLRVRAMLDGEIAALEAHLTDRLAKREDVRLLKTVPGIGAILAATIALEVKDIARFANAGCFASYCRLVASTRISNGKVKGHGSRQMRQPLSGLGVHGGGAVRETLVTAGAKLLSQAFKQTPQAHRVESARAQTRAGLLSLAQRTKAV